MSHAQDNGLATSDRDANTDAANPPTLPPNTGDTDWLDELLRGVGNKYNGSCHISEVLSESEAKAAIEQKLNEARIDELRRVPKDEDYFTAIKIHPYIEDRIKGLQATKEKRG